MCSPIFSRRPDCPTTATMRSRGSSDESKAPRVFVRRASRRPTVVVPFSPETMLRCLCPRHVFFSLFLSLSSACFSLCLFRSLAQSLFSISPSLFHSLTRLSLGLSPCPPPPPVLSNIGKIRNERPHVGGSSNRCRNAAPSRKGCVVNGLMAEARNK